MIRSCDKRPPISIILNSAFHFCLALILHASYFMFKALGSVKWGYFCDDSSIAYPLLEETVSDLYLILFSYLTPIVIVLYVIYKLIVCALIALGIAFFLTSLIKYTLGRLRPFFLEVCKPNKDTIGCANYQENYECQGTNIKKIKESYLSYLSGHASTAFAGAFYTVFYLQTRLHLYVAPLVRPFLQFWCIVGATVISCSRYTDHFHHPTDIICGIILGIVCAMYTFYWYLTIPDDSDRSDRRSSLSLN